MWPKPIEQLLHKLNIDHPLILAPMAGLSSAALVAAVSNAGGLGSFGGAPLTPEQLQKTIKEIRSLTNLPFCINLFAPTNVNAPSEADVAIANEPLNKYRQELGIPLSPEVKFSKSLFDEQLNVVIEEKVPIFSFTFNILPAETIQKIKQHGITVIGTATTVSEAIQLEKNGVDMIVAQGYEAGGHRGTAPDIAIEDALIGTMALVPLLTQKVSVPIIASGGIMNGRGLAAALVLGAQCVQMGTAFLACPETLTHPEHKKALGQNTRLTRAFTGRFVRSINNRFIREMAKHTDTILAYPFQRTLTQDISRKAAEKNDLDFMQLWSGQAGALAQTKSAEILVKEIIEDAWKVFAEF